MQLQRSLAGRQGPTRPAPRPSRGGPALRAVKKGGQKNVVCTKTVLAKAEHAAKVKELCAKYEEDMKENQAGILAFECTEDNFEENAVHFWERYKNSAYFNQGMQSKETTTFLKEVRSDRPPGDTHTHTHASARAPFVFGSRE